MTDMDKALALVPIANAAKTVTQSGPASDPATFGGTALADGDKVYVPPGLTLTLNGTTPRLTWLRVDGTLAIDPNAAVKLFVDTFVTNMGSTLTLDNSAGTGTFTCTFTGGVIDLNADRYVLGRGLIPMGVVTIQGRTSPAYIFSAGAVHGATTITLEAPPVGWNVGDKIVIPGTGYMVNDDDVVTITAIAGNVLIFTPALVHDHVKDATPCSYNSALPRRPIAVGNISPCSIDFVSEATTLKQRGHVMMMSGQMQAVNINYASFRYLGRLDKSVVLTDPSGNVDATQNNPRGRYALHYHKNGVDPTQMQIMNYGLRVIDSPGWGLVNHGSNVCADSCLAYNVYGCSFVCEEGDENGCFCDDVSIRNTAPIAAKTLSTAATDRLAGTVPQSDWLHDGIGFGTMAGPMTFQGRNIAYGAPFAGHVILSAPFKVPPVGGTTLVVLKQNLPDPSITSLASFPPGYVPQNIQGCDSYGCYSGLLPWGLNLNGSAPPPIARSSFSDFHCEVASQGVFLGYESSIDIHDFEIYPIKQDWSDNGSSYGIVHSGVSSDMTITNGIVGRFCVGILAPTKLNNTISGITHDCLTGIRVMNANVPPRQLTIANITGSVMTTAQLNAVVVGHYDHAYFKLQSNIPVAGPYNTPRVQVDVLLYGDMGGSSLYGTPAFWPLITAVPCVQVIAEADVVTLDGKYIFFNEQGPNFPLANLGTTVPAADQALTVGQLYAQQGLAIGGKILPSDAALQARVYGLTSVNPATML